MKERLRVKEKTELVYSGRIMSISHKHACTNLMLFHLKLVSHFLVSPVLKF